MCDEAAGFYGEEESWRSCCAPRFYTGSRRQAIKTIIDLNGIEVANVPTQILFGRESSGIEVFLPVTVMPAGSAYAETCWYGRLSLAAEFRMSVPRLRTRRVASEGSLGTVHRT
jgi:hypothetical protein